MKHVRLILCRHTQTHHNREKRYSGAREFTRLDEMGRTQARQLAEALAALKPVPIAIYSSDLARTQEVTRFIWTELEELPTVFDRRLREVDIGAMGGLLKTEALARFPEMHHRTTAPDYDFRDISGESRGEVIARQAAVFREIVALHGGEASEPAPSVIVIGHGTALRTMLAHLGTGLTLHAQGEYQAVTVTDAMLAH